MKRLSSIISASLAFAMLFTIVSAAVFLPQTPVAHAAITDADWQKGASISPMYTTEYSSESFKRSLDRLRATGANYVTLIIPYYQANRDSTEMHAGWNTPTDQSLTDGINYAHSIGLKVMMKPHLETEYVEWRGNINPADRDSWFRSYTDMLVHYGTIGDALGAEDYCLGTELVMMAASDKNSTNTDHWLAMIGAVRAVYHGKLTYSANWYGELDQVKFWQALDYIGISAYYDLYHASWDNVDELKKSWDNWKTGVIEPIQQQYNKSVVFTELGYRSIDQSYRNPWDWGRWGSYNGQSQANAYEALFSYWTNVPWMKGVQLWKWETDVNAGGQGDTDYTPQNKPAEQTMATWWKTTSTGGTGTGGTSGGDLPTTGSARIGVNSPQNNMYAQGNTLFNANLAFVAITKYKLYWQVDGGVENLMSDNYSGKPHKESLVDVSSWTWKGQGPYKITFIAKNSTGAVVTRQYINLYVRH